ncbi:MAG: hypothetical protein GY870_09765 [archaeon]|nr:hypothetical protein [archaeon]
MIFQYDIQNFIQDFQPLFNAWMMIIMILFGTFALIFAFKTKNDPGKKEDPKYFKNEVLLGIMFFFIAAIYPFLYSNIEEAPGAIYSNSEALNFAIWYNNIIHLVVWVFLILIWRRNNKKNNITLSAEEWKENLCKNYVNTAKKDFRRKNMHFAYLGIVVGLYYLFEFLPEPNSVLGATKLNQAILYQYSILLHVLYLTMLFDMIRLAKFKLLGKFAHDWANASMKPSEIYSFTSAPALLVSSIPFLLWPYGPQLIWSVWIIAAVSDAMASIVGKFFGKVRSKRNNGHKTAEGYFAGFSTTYILVLLVHTLIPFPNINPLELQIMAFAAAIAFFFVDRGVFGKDISDNFLNPIICGITLIIVYSILIAL